MHIVHFERVKTVSDFSTNVPLSVRVHNDIVVQYDIADCIGVLYII